MSSMSLDAALRQFEITEANLEKLSRLLKTASDKEDDSRDAYAIWHALPKIDGWKPEITIYDYNDISIMRFEAQEVGEVYAIKSVEDEIGSVDSIVGEYVYRFKHKRLMLIRQRVMDLVAIADEQVASLKVKTANQDDDCSDEYVALKDAVEEIDTLLGSTFKRPPRWSDLNRHLYYFQSNDIYDITEHDWPSVRPVLTERLYTENEPM